MVTGLFAQSQPADKILGVWFSADNAMKIEIFKSGNTYSGKLIEAKFMFEADGKTPKKDTENPNEKLKSRSRQGLVHITGLVFIDGKYSNGVLYSVESGGNYSIKGELKGPNDLETRGYKGVPMMGKTFRWTRVQ
ncbi:DUF2147 domain-containing protein [Mucilaginibacter sp. JRF]|uniref:DUF2147 domain-containing protein n=1 Tax=Mucilaginibacter sp. JRF TaxID=2780088 RepID=UPI001D16B18B|nr:DUF2147 domain-containing protein [Mucilaginibacter sp. JRF]